MIRGPARDPLLAFVGGAMLTVGWLSVVLGGLCTLAIGFFSIVGVGDHEAHVRLEDWTPAVVMLSFGGACIWAGRQVRRSERQGARDDDRPAA